MSLEIKEEGKIIIKFVEIDLYICRNCYHYFRMDEAGTGLVGKETSYDICPKCESDNIVLNRFGLKVTKTERMI